MNGYHERKKKQLNNQKMKDILLATSSMIFKFNDQRSEQEVSKHYYQSPSTLNTIMSFADTPQQFNNRSKSKLILMKSMNESDSARLASMRSKSDRTIKDTFNYYKDQHNEQSATKALHMHSSFITKSKDSEGFNTTRKEDFAVSQSQEFSKPSTSKKMPKIDFNLRYSNNRLNSLEEEKDELKKVQLLIEKNQSFLGDLEDKIIGSGHRKIKMNKTNLQWHKPLYKYDSETSHKEFIEADKKVGKNGYSKYFNLATQDYTWEKCEVLGKLEKGQYVVKWLNNNRTKAVDSLNLIVHDHYSLDTKDLELRRENALYLRYYETYFHDLKGNFGLNKKLS